MKLCSTCGNEIDDSIWTCPFCEQPQQQEGHTPTKRTKARIRIVTVHLKQDLPTVEEALERLAREIASCRHQGTRVIRVIHGYGSSGTGGKIRTAVRRYLAGQMHSRGIRYYVAGEEYSLFSDTGRKLLADHPELKPHLRTDRENPGITFIKLK